MKKEIALLLISGPVMAGNRKPNILIAIADDMSYPYCSAYGTEGVSTPGFDFVASSGTAFTNAYVCSPGSSPSRASILTGRYPWQLEEAGTHASSFPGRYVCFPDIFAAEGYATGFTGKGWGPGDWKVSGRKHNPAGPEYNEHKLTPPHNGISKIDYTKNFENFLDGVRPEQPFCFWYGANEPHRPYAADAWEKDGRNPGTVAVPPYLPDVDVVKSDLTNYIIEIEWFDRHLRNIIGILRERNLLDNTIVVVTADNGMPFPHAKANCYDAGVHVPLAICWGKNIRQGRTEEAVVSLVDLMPTLLDLAGIAPAPEVSGESMAPLLGRGKKGRYARQSAYSGRERHSSARYRNLGYPIRAHRKGDYLLIRNFHPERWPAGNPLKLDGINLQNGYRDIDDSPTKQYLIAHHFEKECFPYYKLAVDKRPEYELYNVKDDPGCMKDLAQDSTRREVFESMRRELDEVLVRTGDSRVGDNPEIWESYPRLAGPENKFPAE